MKRSACRRCGRVYWARCTRAEGVRELYSKEGETVGWSATVPSEPKTRACWRLRSKRECTRAGV